MIRLATPSDASQMAEIYRPFVIQSPVSFETEAPDEAEMVDRVLSTLKTYPWLVAAKQGQVMGYAYASQHRARYHYQWSVDVSVYIHPDFRRLGIGKALYQPLMAILAVQGFVMAHAGITLPNEGSVGLHEAMGFKPIGVYRNVGYKLGQWHDVGWWELALQAPQIDPAAPIPVGQVIGTPGWEMAITAGS